MREAEDLLASVTSEPTRTEMDEVSRLASVPTEVSSVFYHVVLDSDFGDFVDDLKRQNKASVVFGRVSKKMGERIPVLYNRDEAVRVAKKLINMVVNSGSSGVNMDKRYPYLGAIVIGLNFSNYQTVSNKKITVRQSNDEAVKNDYEGIDSESDLIFYNVNGTSRGLIKKSALSNTKIVDSQYVVRSDLSPDNGFALLNLCSSLSVDNIKTLKCLFMGERSPCFGEGSVRTNERLVQNIDVETKPIVQLGGKYNNYADLARREKAKYLLNKTKQTGGNLDEILYKQKYVDAKMEYLRLKQQKKQQHGGFPLTDDEEEMYRKKYIEVKTRYLKLKQQKQQQGGLLEATDMNVSSSNETYWRPRYEKKKNEYISRKKNSKN
jgi:hypothetical protein